MHNKWTLFYACLITLFSVGANAALVVERTGEPIVGRGIFMPGCVYGENSSLSDHAPMIFTKEGIGTWNITSRVSHRQIRTKEGFFMGHKFRTDDGGQLIDNVGKPAILGHMSEADILSKTTVTNTYYAQRLKRIALKIKSVFSHYDIDYLTLQEIPFAEQKDVERRDLRKILSHHLGPDLKIHFPTDKISDRKTFARKAFDIEDKTIDVALVTRANLWITSPVVDHDNRMQAYCNDEDRRCVVSVHLPSAFTASDIVNRCEAIGRMVKSLKDKNFDRIDVAGDFNSSAEKLARFCGKARGFDPVIKTSRYKAQSCSNNKGDSSPNNIDLLLTFD